MGVSAAYAAVAISAASYAEQKEAAGDAAAARERQAKAERRKAEVQNIRAVREQIREQRIAAARIVARGASSGTLGSSGVAGGVASTQSQLATNLDYMGQVAGANRDIADASVSFGEAQGDIAQAQAMGSLGSTIFSGAGGFKTIFGGNQPADIKTP